MGSLFTRPRARFLVPLDSATKPFRSARSIHFEALILPASPFAPQRVAPQRRPILCWVSASLKPSPSTPWFLDPPRHWAWTCSSARRLNSTTRRTLRPLAPG